ncbi:hypothetical protein [Sphingobacterium multivorum]
MTVDEIYLNIGKSIVNAINDEKWSRATLDIEVVDEALDAEITKLSKE